MFSEQLKDNLSLESCLRTMTNAHEYDELPVRHNEDLLNECVFILKKKKTEKN